LALNTLIDLAKADSASDVVLVHGAVMFGASVIGHAWLESDSEAYDAVDHVTMPTQYVAEQGAVAEQRYTLKEAYQMMCAEKHYGPWHEGAGVAMDSGPVRRHQRRGSRGHEPNGSAALQAAAPDRR
jgi:hypothetical protein